MNSTVNGTAAPATYLQCSGSEAVVNFSEEASVFYASMGVICILATLMTCAGNGLFVAAMIWHARKLTLPQKLLLTLAITDLLQGVSLWPIITTYHFYKMQGTLKCSMMKSTSSLGYDLVMMTVFAILTISLEQFIAVVYPFVYQRYVTLRKVIVLFILLNLVHVLCNYLVNFCLNSKTIWVAYQISIAICLFSLGLVVCACQFQVMFIASAKARDMPNPCMNEKRVLLYRVKAARITLLILSGFLVAYIPFTAYAGYIFVVKSGTLFSRTYVNSTVEVIAQWNSAINPVVYYWRLHYVRTATKSLLGMQKRPIGNVKYMRRKSSIRPSRTESCSRTVSDHSGSSTRT